MDKLSTFEFNNSRKLYELAKKLNSNKFFEIFLTEPQFKIVNYILEVDQIEIWENFIGGNCFLEFSDNIDNEVTSFEPGYTMISALSLHIRYLLWEKAIDFYYDSKNLDESLHTIEEVSDDYELIDLLDKVDENGDKEVIPQVEKSTRQDDEEDNYDEYDEDDDDNQDTDAGVKDSEKNENNDKNHSGANISDQNLQYNDKKQLILKIPFDLVAPPEEPGENLVDSQSGEESKKEIEQDEQNGDEIEKNKDNESKTSEVSVKDIENNHEEIESKDVENEVNASLENGFQSPKANKHSDDSHSMKSPKKPDVKQSSDQQHVSTELVTPSKASLEEQEILIKEFNKVYHNFEFDRDTLIKRRKLEKSDLQLSDNKSNTNSNQNISNSSEIENSNTITFGGSASSSLQHLLSTIQQKRDTVPLSDFELRTLFMDVRKSRGKWANDERVGQEELYEACEKVLQDLRSYTEHSTPFLNKVSKREAPNYGLIIKKPMDLNTVMKKLKNLQYNSKKEFVDDLMLIWSNCLAYNTDPKHFLRAHAIAMQKKTIKLAPTIPNIVIRSRAEIEKEDELDNDRSTPLESAGKSMKKGRKRSRQDQIKQEDSKTSMPSSPEPSFRDVQSLTPAPENGTGMEEDDEEEEENDHIEADSEEDEEDIDPELQAWRTLTAKSRANYCMNRANLFDENSHLRFDAEAIVRQSGDNKNFNQYLNNSEVISKTNNLLENDEPYLLEYDITGGLPGIAYKGVDQEEEDIRENRLADIYLQQAGGDASNIKSRFVLPIDKGLNKVYFDNIHQIQEIRKICFKISLIRQMQTQQFVHHTQMKQPDIEPIREVDVDPVSKLPNHDYSSNEIQFAVLRRNIAKIAMQTGFETTEPTAINTLTQLAEKYLGNLIKTMKLHCESSTSNKLSEREILLVSLVENGVDKPDDLYTYVQEKILKQQDKLIDLRNKLSNFLKELLRPGLENFNERSFEDNSEQFMTGDFSNDLGDDFFGFKELGLDREFKMLSRSIPIYLLHSRLHNQFSNSGNLAKRNKFEDLKDFKPQDLRACDIQNQIGILNQFYRKLYDKSVTQYIKIQKKKNESTDLPENDMLPLVEDEELPQKQRNIRPKLPPTGKIAGVKKKIIANSFFLPDDPDIPPEENVNSKHELEPEFEDGDFSILDEGLPLEIPT